jgi:exopolysaccharide biosynthesis polyprenyl glycosylphosphotransferase
MPVERPVPEKPDVGPAATSDGSFSPFARTHTFQRQLHQVSDAVLIAAAFVIAYEIRKAIPSSYFPRVFAVTRYAWSYLVVVPASMYLLSYFGLYKRGNGSQLRLAWIVTKGASLSLLFTVGLAYLFKDQVVLLSRIWLVLFTVLTIVLVSAKHLAWQRYSTRGGARRHHGRTVALVGARQQNHDIAHLVANHPEWGIAIAAEFDLNDYSSERLADALHQHHVDCVMLTTGKFSFDRIGQTLCETEGVDVLLMADFVRPSIARISFDEFDRRPVLRFSSKPDRAWSLLFKRFIDFVGAACLLAIAGPLIILPVAIAIRLTSNGPIFFRQLRCGLHGKRFTMLKFRSMVANAEELRANLITLNEQSGPAFKIARDPRITSLGRIIRKTSIDELPQLWNVLVGEMSLVGPRPPIPSEVEKYAAWQRRRLSMKPGLTCLWQISGRNHIKFDEWMRLDLAYIDSWSLLLDLQILAKTIPAVVKGDGAT